MFYIELVWNREFDWSRYGGEYPTQDIAESVAESLLNMGDGASVKKARVLNDKGGVVVPYVSC